MRRPGTPSTRPMSRSDLDAVLELNNAAVPAVNELTMADLEWFAEVAHTFLVVDRGGGGDGSVAGFLIGLDGPGLDYHSLNYRWFSERYDRFVYVDRIVVAESARGRGTGGSLYDAFAVEGRADGHHVMLAEVNLRPPNAGSLRFHRRHGFVRVGEQDTEGGAKRVTLLARDLTSGAGPSSPDLAIEPAP
ncbi:MAG: GNAT family N-acetyltransferase [Acidimicrobiales bacterium]